MIKDILVNVSVAPIRDVAAPFAVSVATAFDAHLTGVAFVYEPVPPAVDMTTMPGELIDTMRSEHEKAAEAARAMFDRLTERAGASATSRKVDATLVGAAELFGRMARRFDLAVVGQASPADVGRAVAAARTAYGDGWSSLPGSERAKYLFRIARILQERSREFAVLESLNGGKPIKDWRATVRSWKAAGYLPSLRRPTAARVSWEGTCPAPPIADR